MFILLSWWLDASWSLSEHLFLIFWEKDWIFNSTEQSLLEKINKNKTQKERRESVTAILGGKSENQRVHVWLFGENTFKGSDFYYFAGNTFQSLFSFCTIKHVSVSRLPKQRYDRKSW